MYSYVKAAIFALLLLNTGIYASVEDRSSALDAIAWLILLVLFEWETTRNRTSHDGRIARLVHVTRIGATLAVILAAGAFIYEQEWIDAANSVLWIAVVILLEFELRFPHIVALQGTGIVTIATLLYGALAALVIVWAWRGEWLDAYDALLWILAFAIIEMDMLRFSRRAA
jgi:hypothetical protein